MRGATTTDRPSPVAAWLAAIRPRTLGASAVPVLTGLAVASREGSIDVLLGVCTLGSATCIQVATNLANDVADFARGADDEDRLGPPRATQSGWIAPRAMWTGTTAAIALAIVLAIPLLVAGGWTIVAIGAVSLACVLAYTTGPWPLAYVGLGDLFVFVFFGPVAVVGTAWLQTGTIEPVAVAASAVPGLLAVAILIPNNLRDVEGDRRAGKWTLPARWGERFAVAEYRAVIAAAFVAAFAVAAAAAPPAALVGLALPLAWTEAREISRRRGAELNRSLAGSARLHLVAGLLFALGIALG